MMRSVGTMMLAMHRLLQTAETENTFDHMLVNRQKFNLNLSSMFPPLRAEAQIFALLHLFAWGELSICNVYQVLGYQHFLR